MKIEDIQLEHLVHPHMKRAVQTRLEHLEDAGEGDIVGGPNPHVYLPNDFKEILLGAQLYAGGDISDSELFDRVQTKIPFRSNRDWINMNLSVAGVEQSARRMGMDARELIAAYVLDQAGLYSFEQVSIIPNAQLSARQVDNAIRDDILPGAQVESQSVKHGLIGGLYAGPKSRLSASALEDGVCSMVLYGNPLERSKLLRKTMQAAEDRDWSLFSGQNPAKPLLLGSPGIDKAYEK